MTDTLVDSTLEQRNIIEYLKSLQSSGGDLDVEVNGAHRSGVLQVRNGRVVAAECGELRGNGALFTLAALDTAQVREHSPKQQAEQNVSISSKQLSRFFAKVTNLSKDGARCDEQQTLQDGIRLLFSFRRKEASAKLVEVLRCNRFHYPAWLWYSRLMNREEYINKALKEAGIWGNADTSIESEKNKIEPRLTGSTAKVKRCIFCWSPVGEGKDRCDNCHGLQLLPKIDDQAESAAKELQQALSLYESALAAEPDNLRIAYCLCLGYCSLGDIDRAREFLEKAKNISPEEPILAKADAVFRPAKQAPEQIPEQAPEQEPAPSVVEAEEPSDQSVEPVEPAVSVAQEEQGAGKTILVVEDSKTARKVISVVLNRKGYNIIEASSGSEALLAAAGVAPDLVLLDLMLPDMSGFDVLASIRKNSELSEVPVVMLTGKQGATDRQKGMMIGSNEYLTKPFDPAKLLVVLDKYLGAQSPSATPQQKIPEEKSKTEVQPTPAKPVARGKEPEVKPAAVRPAEPETRAVKSAPEPPKDSDRLKSVLVVEDSPTSRKVISVVLSRNGFTVREAATGSEALDQLEQGTPKLILLDAMLPDMTGYEILALLKQDQRLKDIPVVMLTAKDSPIDREKGMRAGSNAYLTKPFDPDKLLSVIGGYI